MQNYGIEITSVDFKNSVVKDDDLIIHVSYKIKLKYPFFGFSEVTLRQQASAKVWS